MLELFKTRKHKNHLIHQHSVESWNVMMGTLPKRKALIMDAVVSGGAGTDRQIMERVMLSEPNMVRPSITILIKKGMLVEIGDTKCHVTGKKVRLVDLPQRIK